MVQFNLAKKEIIYKIVYYGPPSSGKTTNFKLIQERIAKPESPDYPKENMSTEFLSVDVGIIDGIQSRFTLFFLPGPGDEVRNSAIKRVLQEIDGIVFVADSGKIQENVDAFKNLERWLQEKALDIRKIPLVIQWNKRDIPGVLNVKELHDKVNYLNAPEFNTIAIHGEGIFSAIEKLASIVVESTKKAEQYRSKFSQFAQLGQEQDSKEKRALFSFLSEKTKAIPFLKNADISSPSGTEKNTPGIAQSKDPGMPASKEKEKKEEGRPSFSMQTTPKESGSIGAFTLIKLSGTIDQTSSKTIKEGMTEAMKNHIRLILDFADVVHIHSIGFGILVEISNRAKILGREVRVISLKDKYKIAFELMGMEQSMPIYVSEEEAIKSFATVPKQEQASYLPEMSSLPVPQERTGMINRYKMLSSTLSPTQSVRLHSFSSRQKKNIYLSYDANDVNLAKKIETNLQDSGYEVWRDRRRVEQNVDWNEETSQLLLDTNVMILLWSENSGNSSLVRHEWLAARAVGKLILLCLLQENFPVPHLLKENPSIPFTEYENALNILKDKLSSRPPVNYNYSILPAFCYMPFKSSSDFVGREEEILSLYRKVMEFKKVIIQQDPCVRELEGIGKTRLAIEFVYRFGFAFPDGIIWLNGGNNWPKELQRAAYMLNLTDDSYNFCQSQDALHKLREYIQNHPNMLILIDNLTAEDLKDEVAPEFLLMGLECNLIATTGDSQTIPGTAAVQLSPLSQESSIQLLSNAKKTESQTENDAIKKLSNLIGGLPLALELIRKFFLKNSDTTFSQYLQSISQSLPAQKANNEYDYPAIVGAILKKQWESLQDSYTQRLFEISGLFPKGSMIYKETIGLLAGLAPDTRRIHMYFKSPFDLLVGMSLVEEIDREFIRVPTAMYSYLEKNHYPQAEQMQKVKKKASEWITLAYKDISRMDKEYTKRGVFAILEDIQIALQWSEGEEIIRNLQWCLVRELPTLQKQSFLPNYFVQQLYNRIYIENDANAPLLKDIEASLPRLLKQKGSCWLKRCNRSNTIEIQNFSSRGDTFSAFFSFDGCQMAAGGKDSVTIWDTTSSRQINSLGTQDALCRSVILDSSNKQVIAGHKNEIHIWNLSPAKINTILTGHSDWVYSLSLSNKSLLASGSKDQTIRIWDMKTGKQTLCFEDHEGAIFTLCFSPDGDHLLSGGQDKIIRLWQSSKGNLVHTLRGHSEAITALCFYPDNHLCLSGSRDYTIRLWDVFSGKMLSILTGHNGTVTSLCFSHDGTYIISGSTDKTLRVWESKSGRLLQIFTSDNPIIQCQFNGTSDEIWAADTQACIYKFKFLKI